MSSVKSFALCILILVIVAGSSAARAQCTAPSFSPDFTNNQSCLTLTGINYDVLPPQLTRASIAPVSAAPSGSHDRPAAYSQMSSYWAGSAWYDTQQPVAGAFSTTFTFQLSGTTNGKCRRFCVPDSKF
jgi:hypothetical protein